MKCSICNIYPAVHETPETEEYICELCEIRKKVYIHIYENRTYYPPVGIKKINTFDDGNQKYENDPNEWLQIGHDLNHPEKIILVNKITNTIIYSISNWKVSNIN